MRRLWMVALLLAASCGKSPSSPTQPASPPPTAVAIADFSGMWTAKYRMTACEWERHCVLFIGQEREFNLRLVQTGSLVRGLFVQGGLVTDIEGTVSSDGVLSMSGYAPPASSLDGSFRVTELRLRQGAAPELQGQVGYESRLAPQYTEVGLGMKVSGEIVSAVKSDLTGFARLVEGTYRGRFVVRTCTPIGRYCYPDQLDEVGDLILTVGSGGTSVSATYQRGGTRIDLHGTASGSSVELSGERLQSANGTTTTERVTNWRGTVDEFGRMSGRFHFDFVFAISQPSLGGSADCELVQLVKQAS